MLNNTELDEALEKSPSERVTKAYIESRIEKGLGGISWHRFNLTVTICQIKLDNGYTVRGESVCVNVENYDKEIGERISYDNAFAKLWPLFGFLLAEKNFRISDKPSKEAA